MLTHADMPAADKPTEEFETFQATHEPIVTMRVWLGDDHGMVSVKWAAEVVNGEAPVEAGVAVMLLHQAVHALAEVAAKTLAPLVMDRES